MKLYLITNMERQHGSLDYYDAIIVSDENKKDAKEIAKGYEMKKKFMVIEKIGKSTLNKKGVVLTSFNAG